MGLCTFCREKAGFLRSSHKACRDAHSQGEAQILSLAKNAALDTSPLERMPAEAEAIAAVSFIEPASLKSFYIKGWEDALEAALGDHALSYDEEKALNRYRDFFALGQNQLDANGAYSTMVKALVLRDTMEGKKPSRLKVDGRVPFNLQKSETLIWLFQNAQYHEERTRKSYKGGYAGASVRVAKGLYFRTGGFRGHPVETTSLVHVDTGIVGITNKHIYFAGPRTSLRVAFRKIISFTPYSDGLGVHRDAMSAKPQIFITGDGWFTYNLVVNLAEEQ